MTPLPMKQITTFLFFFALTFPAFCQHLPSADDQHEGHATSNFPYTFQFHAQQVSLEKSPAHGSCDLVKSGTLTHFSYTPDIGFVGQDTIILLYQQIQNGGKFRLKRFIINSQARIVVAQPDYYSITGASSDVLLPVTDNDLVLDGVSPLEIREIVGAYHGQADIADNVISFLPDQGFTGRASVIYTVCSEEAGCSTAEALIRVDNEIPDFEEIYLLPKSQQHVIQLPQGYEIVTSAVLLYGSLRHIAPGTYIYKPVGTAVGLESIQVYKLNCATDCLETYKIEVVQTSAQPDMTQPDYLFAPQGTPYTFNPLMNDMAATHIINKLDQGSISSEIWPNGWAITTTPATEFEGEATLGYMVKPKNLPLSALAPLEWGQAHIKFSNQHPVSGTFRLPVVANADNLIPIRTHIESYQIDVVVPPVHGSLQWFAGVQEIMFNGQSVSGLNQLIYTPHTGYSGNDQATVRRCAGSDCRDIVLSFDLFDDVQPPHTAVWPGDMNNDGQVALDDLLTWSYFAGYVAQPRAQTGTAFKAVAQTEQFIGAFGFDSAALAFADADGNGLINLSDLEVAKKHQGKKSGITSADRLFTRIPVMSLTTTGIAQPLDTVSLTMELGHALLPNLQTRCFAFSIQYDTDQIKPGSFHATLNNGYLDQGAVELYVFDDGLGRVDVAVMPIGKYNTVGFGQVLTVKFIVDDIIDGFKSLTDLTQTTLKIQNFVHGNFEGQIFGAADQNIEIAVDRTSFVSQLPFDVQDMIRMWPNPSSTFFKVDMQGLQRIRAIRVTDTVGRLVYEQLGINTIDAVQIDHMFASGLYMVQVFTDSGVASLPLLVQSR
jgi:hypothetical protein